jgi:hypothetical protein
MLPQFHQVISTCQDNNTELVEPVISLFYTVFLFCGMMLVKRRVFSVFNMMIITTYSEKNTTFLSPS